MDPIQLKIRKVIVISVLSVGMFFMQSHLVSADVLSDRIADVSTAVDETTFVQSIVKLSVPIATMSLVGLTAYAGFLMITSQGNPEKLSEAREVLTNAFLGFGLIALSVAVLIIIQNVLKLPGISP